MSIRTCFICDEDKPEDTGEVVEQTAVTKRWGIPTGFICADCLADTPEYNGPRLPHDLSACPTAADAAQSLSSFLQSYLKATDGNPEQVHLYPPEKTREITDGHEAWVVAWESGPFEWAINLTGGDSMYRGELGTNLGNDPQVIGFHAAGWTAEPHHSYDICFSD